MLSRTEVAVITFPRSGSFFLKGLIENNSGLKVIKTHVPDLTKTKTVITIARNPKDTITSYLAMLAEYRDFQDYEGVAKELLNDYVENYKYFMSHADIIIDFDNLVNHPEQTLKAILQATDQDIPEQIEVKTIDTDMIDVEHLSSSKKSLSYNEMSIICDHLDMSDAIIMFENIKRKSINANL